MSVIECFEGVIKIYYCFIVERSEEFASSIYEGY